MIKAHTGNRVDISAVSRCLPVPVPDLDHHTLLTVTETAGALNVTPSCIRRWILERRIAIVKIGRLVRIPAGEIQRIIEGGLRPAKATLP